MKREKILRVWTSSEAEAREVLKELQAIAASYDDDLAFADLAYDVAHLENAGWVSLLRAARNYRRDLRFAAERAERSRAELQTRYPDPGNQPPTGLL